MLDLVAFTGYKYIGLCVNMVAGAALGRGAYYASLLWTAAAAFWALKTAAHAVPQVGWSQRNHGMGASLRRTRCLRRAR